MARVNLPDVSFKLPKHWTTEHLTPRVHLVLCCSPLSLILDGEFLESWCLFAVGCVFDLDEFSTSQSLQTEPLPDNYNCLLSVSRQMLKNTWGLNCEQIGGGVAHCAWLTMLFRFSWQICWKSTKGWKKNTSSFVDYPPTHESEVEALVKVCLATGGSGWSSSPSGSLSQKPSNWGAGERNRTASAGVGGKWLQHNDTSSYFSSKIRFLDGSKTCVYLFRVFEFVAAALHWPKGVWSLLLQCQLVGKAPEVCSAVSSEDGLQYDNFRNALLRAGSTQTLW